MLKKILLSAAVITFGLTGQAAYAQQGQFQRIELEKVELPGTQYNVVLVLADIPAGFTVDRHTHPGVEAGYVLQGDGDFIVEGQPDRHLKTGDHFKIGGPTPHIFRAGPATKILVTYVVDKTKPLASPAPK
jgi:quercetin dioxygenase-like cupin family protein